MEQENRIELVEANGSPDTSGLPFAVNRASTDLQPRGTVPTQRCAFRAGRYVAFGAFGVAAGALACGHEPMPPPTVASVTITSPIGNRMGVGRTVQLSAEALDSRGRVVSGITFTWNSSATSIARADATGLVSGIAAGPVTISAEGGGVTGTLGLQVKAVDFDAIAAALNDPFGSALVGSLTSTVRTRVQAAFTQCAAGVAQGNFTTIETCLASGRAEIAAATDPTDRALLATLALYFDYIERRLNG